MHRTVIAALFTIAEIWKQPKFPLTGEETKKMWYVHPTEYYSAFKEKEILPLQQHRWTQSALYSVK